MVESVDPAGLPSELEPVDYLWHRGEANPRTRPGCMDVNLLDTTPDWSRFRASFENASRRVLRLRQKVVVPTLPSAAPRWVVDPDFNLDFHVRRVRVPEPGTLRDVFDLAELVLRSPMDISRPLWTVTLVEGLADGTAAMLFHRSHAVADGIGAVEMFAPVYDLERDPAPEPIPPQPIPQNLSPNDLMREGIKHLPGAAVRAVGRALWAALLTVRRVVLSPRSALAVALGYARSVVRVMTWPAEPSPLLRERSLASRIQALDIRLSDLHRAAKAGGGSINDAYLAGLCGALGRYHEALGAPIGTLPTAVPVNVRAEADHARSNRVVSVSLAAPVGTADPVARMREIRAQMTQRREEPAVNITVAVVPLLNVLPTPLLQAVTTGQGIDVAASNVRGNQGDTYIAGAKVLRQYCLGPLLGAGMGGVLLSSGGWCTITVRHDRSSVRDEKLFAQCLLEGFDEILALAGEAAPRAISVAGPIPGSPTRKTPAQSR
jgi:WS/DGAT/MGAT family acyltransferase